MPTLDHAINIASSVHLDQKDQAGQPYILHSLRVMFNFVDDTHRIVAVLHDVLEDSSFWTLEKLSEVGFSNEVVRALDAITRRKGEKYLDYIERVQNSGIAERVKIADLRDNLSEERVGTLSDSQREKYVVALGKLTYWISVLP